MQERQLHCILDFLDLRVQPTNVVVGDVWDFLENQFLNLGARQPLKEQARARIHQQGIACPQLGTDELLGQFGDPLLVSPAHHHGAPPVSKHFLEGHHFA